jgi:Tfp pilus assembly protein PilV
MNKAETTLIIKTNTSRGRAGGFTLFEALLAAVMLASVVAAILMPFTAGAQNEREDARQSLAVSLAQEMMEEILSKPYADPNGTSNPGPESGETSRSLYDNMDDYNGYSEAAGQIHSADGTLIADPAAADLSRYVTCAYVYVSGQDTSATPNFLQITVEVRKGSATVAKLTRLAQASQH